VLLGDAAETVNSWSAVVGGLIGSGAVGGVVALYFAIKRYRAQAKRDDIVVRREETDAEIEARRKADEADHANETYAVQVMRGLYSELQAEFRQAKKDHVALEKSVVKIQIDANAALSKCMAEHAVTTERLRASEVTAASLKDEVRALEERLAAVEGRT